MICGLCKKLANRGVVTFLDAYLTEIKTFNVKIMQEVWRCEGKKVFLQPNSVKRLKGEDYETDISNGRY